MIKAAVGSASQLPHLAGKPPVEVWSPWAGLQSSGQVVAPGGRAGDVLPACLPAGCCRDCGTPRATMLPRFVEAEGSSRIRALSLILHPKTPALLQQGEASS